MIAADARVYHVGGDHALRAALAAALGREVEPGPPAEPRPGDLVVCEAAAGSELPEGNAFSACRRWKEDPRVGVYMVVGPDDRYGGEIARFCLADGTLVWRPPDTLQGVEDLVRGHGTVRARVSVDALLTRLEQEMAGDEGRRVSAVQRLLNREEEDSLLVRLQDRETGLFNAAYASLKLDEEFKRALRFHQPLSLILLDIGLADGGMPQSADDRRTFLAEVASVYLNECRDIDILARFTETTFLFLLPGTGLDGAATLARRMLDSLRERSYSSPVRLQPHAGLATVPATGIADRRGFLIVAEACLRRAQAGQGEGGLCTSWE